MDAGDKVRITTKDAVYEGILMPRPGMLEEGFLVLKLDNGYNIGIDEKKILNKDVLAVYAPKKTTQVRVEKKAGFPVVSILSFGGTISSKIDYRTGGTYADYTAEDFVQMCPELTSIANIKARKVLGMMSEDFTYKEWQIMAREAAKELNSDADGVVITQGTDTLHFSTAALSFMLKDLPKPVVFTAAQRSIDRGSTDAFMNLICAVKAAASSDCAEVMTCLHGTSSDDYCLLIRGSKVRKMHTSRRDAFRPINEMPIAKVHADGKIEVLNPNYRKRKQRAAIVAESFELKVALLLVHPNFDPKVIDYYLSNGYRGIVLGATALGHVNSTGEFNVIPYIEKAIKAGLIVAISSQTLYGSTHKYVYTNLRKLSVQLGCVFAEDMLPETAYVKLGWALGQKDGNAKELFMRNIAGEMSSRITADTFLY